MDAPLLAVEGLHAAFPTRRGLVRAVDGVDFTLARGEVLALLGESGCGKSVTSLALMGLLPASARVAGRIRFRGEDLRGLSPDALRDLRGAALAMVFQEPMASLNPVLPVGRQVAEVLVAHGRADRRAARARAIALFGEVGLSEPERRYDAYPHELSGGMCQRVMIAMAIACDPVLLIADEPTTALDVTIQKQILALIEDLRRRRGTAVLLITHDLGVVAHYCDEMAVMYAGAIVESGPVKTVFANPSHPYTQNLIGATPERIKLGAARSVGGTPPNLYALPAGCAYSDRCPRLGADCAIPPRDVALGAGHVARCHRLVPA